MPHFASSFTGGPEIVLPGSSSIRSITKNRSLLTKGFPASSSPADNHILLDSLEASKLAGPFYSLCFMPDGAGGVTSAFAGEPESALSPATSSYPHAHSPQLERKLATLLIPA